MKKLTTFNVLITLSILATAWEIWTIINNEDGDTFSATIRRLGVNQPFIIFMLGMLSGHLWWPLLDGEKAVVLPESK
jgi:hypothetical protein